MASEEKADVLVAQIKELNSNFKWLREYIEEHDLGPAINDIADDVSAVKGVFEQVHKIEGGVGVVNALIQGLRNHGKGEKR